MPRPTRIVEAITVLALAAAPAMITCPAVLAAAASPAPAAPGASASQGESQSAAPAAAAIHVKVSGEEITDLEHPPVIRNGSMLIPLNGILDRMAATVAWQPLIGRVDVQRGATHLQLQVGSAQATVNGKTQEMDVAPELAGDVIMVPLRFTADALGLYTTWDSGSRTISLSTVAPQKAAPPAVPASPGNGSVSTPPAANTTTPILPPVTPSDGPLTSPPAAISTGGSLTPAPASGSAAPSSAVASTPGTPGAADNPGALPPELPPSASQPGAAVPPTAPNPPVTSGDPVPPTADDTPTGSIAAVTRKDGQASVTLDNGATYPLADNAVLLANTGSGRSREVVTVDDLIVGDQVVLHLDGRRQVSLLEVTYRTMSGSVRAVAGDQILLGSGQVVHASPSVLVDLPTGKTGHLSEVPDGTAVVLRINPTSGLVSRVQVGGASVQGAQPGGEAGSSVFVESPGPYRAGDPLTVTLHGAPGAAASFTMPGSQRPVAMKEYEPGTYKGTAVVPPGISIKDGAIVGEIQGPGQPASVIPSTTPITIDSTPPSIQQMSPAPGSVETNHQAAIYAVLDDHNGTGVDPSSVHLILNGQDVTGQAQTSEKFVACSGLALVDGLNRVAVGVRDRAGNYTLAHWEFTVSSLQNEIHKVAFSTSPSHGGEKISVSMDGIAGGDASFDVGANWLAQPMHEVKPGHYEGTLVLERGDRVINTPVTGHIKAGDHVFSLTSTDVVTFVDGKPAAPTIDLPAVGSSIEAPLVVAGHADPGARVHVRVEYDNRALSRIGLRGFSSDQTVTADDTGAWRTGPMSLDSLTPHARHLAYVITCDAINAGGAASKKVRVTVYRDAS